MYGLPQILKPPGQSFPEEMGEDLGDGKMEGWKAWAQRFLEDLLRWFLMEKGPGKIDVGGDDNGKCRLPVSYSLSPTSSPFSIIC
jgi:hypothetical protein